MHQADIDVLLASQNATDRRRQQQDDDDQMWHARNEAQFLQNRDESRHPWETTCDLAINLVAMLARNPASDERVRRLRQRYKALKQQFEQYSLLLPTQQAAESPAMHQASQTFWFDALQTGVHAIDTGNWAAQKQSVSLPADDGDTAAAAAEQVDRDLLASAIVMRTIEYLFDNAQSGTDDLVIVDPLTGKVEDGSNIDIDAAHNDLQNFRTTIASDYMTQTERRLETEFAQRYTKKTIPLTDTPPPSLLFIPPVPMDDALRAGQPTNAIHQGLADWVCDTLTVVIKKSGAQAAAGIVVGFLRISLKLMLRLTKFIVKATAGGLLVGLLLSVASTVFGIPLDGLQESAVNLLVSTLDTVGLPDIWDMVPLVRDMLPILSTVVSPVTQAAWQFMASASATGMSVVTNSLVHIQNLGAAGVLSTAVAGAGVAASSVGQALQRSVQVMATGPSAMAVNIVRESMVTSVALQLALNYPDKAWSLVRHGAVRPLAWTWRQTRLVGTPPLRLLGMLGWGILTKLRVGADSLATHIQKRGSDPQRELRTDGDDVTRRRRRRRMVSIATKQQKRRQKGLPVPSPAQERKTLKRRGILQKRSRRRRRRDDDDDDEELVRELDSVELEYNRSTRLVHAASLIRDPPTTRHAVASGVRLLRSSGVRGRAFALDGTETRTVCQHIIDSDDGIADRQSIEEDGETCRFAQHAAGFHHSLHAQRVLRDMPDELRDIADARLRARVSLIEHEARLATQFVTGDPASELETSATRVQERNLEERILHLERLEHEAELVALSGGDVLLPLQRDAYRDFQARYANFQALSKAAQTQELASTLRQWIVTSKTVAAGEHSSINTAPWYQDTLTNLALWQTGVKDFSKKYIEPLAAYAVPALRAVEVAAGTTEMVSQLTAAFEAKAAATIADSTDVQEKASLEKLKTIGDDLRRRISTHMAVLNSVTQRQAAVKTLTDKHTSAILNVMNQRPSSSTAGRFFELANAHRVTAESIATVTADASQRIRLLTRAVTTWRRLFVTGQRTLQVEEFRALEQLVARDAALMEKPGVLSRMFGWVTEATAPGLAFWRRKLGGQTLAALEQVQNIGGSLIQYGISWNDPQRDAQFIALDPPSHVRGTELPIDRDLVDWYHNELNDAERRVVDGYTLASAYTPDDLPPRIRFMSARAVSDDEVDAMVDRIWGGRVDHYQTQLANADVSETTEQYVERLRQEGRTVTPAMFDELREINRAAELKQYNEEREVYTAHTHVSWARALIASLDAVAEFSPHIRSRIFADCMSRADKLLIDFNRDRDAATAGGHDETWHTRRVARYQLRTLIQAVDDPNLGGVTRSRVQLHVEAWRKMYGSELEGEAAVVSFVNSLSALGAVYTTVSLGGLAGMGIAVSGWIVGHVLATVSAPVVVGLLKSVCADRMFPKQLGFLTSLSQAENSVSRLNAWQRLRVQFWVNTAATVSRVPDVFRTLITWGSLPAALMGGWLGYLAPAANMITRHLNWYTVLHVAGLTIARRVAASICGLIFRGGLMVLGGLERYTARHKNEWWRSILGFLRSVLKFAGVWGQVASTLTAAIEMRQIATVEAMVDRVGALQFSDPGQLTPTDLSTLQLMGPAFERVFNTSDQDQEHWRAIFDHTDNTPTLDHFLEISNDIHGLAADDQIRNITAFVRAHRTLAGGLFVKSVTQMALMFAGRAIQRSRHRLSFLFFGGTRRPTDDDDDDDDDLASSVQLTSEELLSEYRRAMHRGGHGDNDDDDNKEPMIKTVTESELERVGDVSQDCAQAVEHLWAFGNTERLSELMEFAHTTAHDVRDNQVDLDSFMLKTFVLLGVALDAPP